MKKLLFTVVLMLVSQNVLADGLKDALSQAIQSSDTEKATTKEVLAVTVDQIEKATFRRGQNKQVLKDESTVIAESTYQAPEIKRHINTDDNSALESLENELKSKRH